MEETVKIALLLHYFDGEALVHQTILWFKFESSRELVGLVDLIAKGKRKFGGSEEFPRYGESYARIRVALGDIYNGGYDLTSGTSLRRIERSNEIAPEIEVRVMQVILIDGLLEQPRFSMF